ncbi:MAG: hypothetical protein JSR54_00795 [Proteobacteria bacterium]|nr:hypothetical protein [Pseudomonadota bacterium]
MNWQIVDGRQPSQTGQSDIALGRGVVRPGLADWIHPRHGLRWRRIGGLPGRRENAGRRRRTAHCRVATGHPQSGSARTPPLDRAK